MREYKDFFGKFDEDESIIIPDHNDFFTYNHYHNHVEPEYLITEDDLENYFNSLDNLILEQVAKGTIKEQIVDWLEYVINKYLAPACITDHMDFSTF